MSDPHELRRADGKRMLDRALASDEQRFGSFFLSRLFGFNVEYENQDCIVSFEASPALTNPQGTLHGGVLATALDISMGHLLNKTDAPGTTLEMKVQFLAPVTGGIVTCRGQFLRRGRSISFLQSSAVREDGELAAHATATWKKLK